LQAEREGREYAAAETREREERAEGREEQLRKLSLGCANRLPEITSDRGALVGRRGGAQIPPR